MTDLWQDPTAAVEDRVSDLVGRMTLPEKLAQLRSYWGVAADAGAMAPMLQEGMGPTRVWADSIDEGLGQITRPFGTHLPQRFMCQPGPQRQPTVSMGSGAALGLTSGMACAPAADSANVPAAKAMGRKYFVNMRCLRNLSLPP